MKGRVLTCTWCGREVEVRADGLALKRHGPKGSICRNVVHETTGDQR